ncbi:MAG TPA: type II toxin-antitoxin system PemK/MazF family toxin [Syntrophomonadaceae bacterium]|nr:type II toxin-antitoxin system PemK/MazF family toxin [Syntrophomonadaceae bacterium]
MNTIRKRFIIERGDIYLIKLTGAGSSKGIKRPVLVIQNDIGNLYCNSVIIVPLFPNYRLKKMLLAVEIKAGGGNGLARDHIAPFTQIRTIDKSLLHKDYYLGQADKRVMQRVDEAIKLSLGLSTVQRLQAKQQLRRKWRLLTTPKTGDFTKKKGFSG